MNNKTEHLQSSVSEYTQLISVIFSEKTAVITNPNAVMSTIHNVLSGLTSREQEIIAMRFGLIDGQAKTLQQIGNIFGVTRERIRQIEKKVLRKLKHPTRIKQLEPHVSFNDTSVRSNHV